MSQPTSSATNAFSWNGVQHRRDLEQGHVYPVNSKTRTNGQVPLQSVQRVDSFNTSNSSHEPFSTFSTESSFNFDHPTPVDSTDGHTFRTPEIEELLWPETYNEDDNLHLGNESAVYHNSGPFVDDAPPSAGLASHKNSLPSPQSTNISTPEAYSHTQQPSQSSTLFTSPMTTPIQFKRSLEHGMESSLPRERGSQLHTPAQTSPHITSPVIQISSHPRGDSPARSDYERRTFSKKRSASNLSQGEYFPSTNEESQTSMLMPPRHDDEEEEWEEHDSDRTGVAPANRDEQEHPSFNEMEQQQEQDKAISEVQHWLQATTLEPSSARHARGHIRPDRIRSRSTGARPHPRQHPILKNSLTPGPGAMVDEDSDYHYSSDDEESNISLTSDDQPVTLPPELPPRRDSEIAPNDPVPLPSAYHRSTPWQDSYPAHPPNDDTQYQPVTANAAIYKFNQKAKEFDNLSRRATWGTQQTGRRRLSDGDMESIIGESKTRHLSLSKTRNIMQEVKARAKEQLKRSNSRSKHAIAELEKVQSPEPIDDRSSTDSQPHPPSSTYPKVKSPSISTGLRGATGSLAAVGAATTGLNIETEPPTENFIKRTMRRVRSKSDVNKSPKSPAGFKSMIAQEGGMPFPSLASPSQEPASAVSQSLTPVTTTQDLRMQTQSPIKMPLSPRPANVMPNFEGFKVQILELNPRLANYLVDRIAHDQVRRYKRLVKNKVDHVNACAEANCQSGHLCSSVGGEAEVLPTRANGRDAPASSAQFKVAPGPDSDNDDAAFDGIVTPAAFPDGIPLPPTKKLPAKFECPLCFQVKSFQKPSDWTKHVHEDVQPFTCTFQGCQEPKSFKRKADWVRHENERHRHLEWWKCNISECTHICYRKDNFVQHLVREHKRKEPKIRGRVNPNGKGKAKGATNAFNQEEQEFWNLVDECRHEGATDAKSEPCKFCGNVCASWKKLSVHVGKHMEQIAMPVLDLAQKRNVTKDTIISPIEPLPNRNVPFFGTDQHIADPNSALSPYSQSGPSYHSSSAEHSPAALHTNTQSRFGMSKVGGFHSGYGNNGAQQGTMHTTPYGYNLHAGSTGFTAYVGYEGSQYGSFGGQQVLYPQSHPISASETIPQTTAAMNTGYVSMQNAYDDQPQYYSSPEQHYLPYQSGAMVGQNPMQIQMQGQMQTPVTTHATSGNEYVYAQQPPWQHH